MFLVSAYDANDKMSIRYLSKSKKAKKGISPVIATVILVAVAVVIAAALAGFSSSLFGSYSQNAQIQIRSVELHADGTGFLDVVNKGASAETVSKVSATIGPTGGSYTIADIAVVNPTVGANSATPSDFTDPDAMSFAMVTIAAPADLVAGQTVTITVQTQSGQQYSLSTVVQT